MDKVPNKILWPVNALLALTALFTLALTFYSCSKFYSYLPTSDTWIYTDFLAQAAQGHLDVHALFIRHNNTHLIVLPKLVYFFDMWLTNGTGALVMSVSLTAMLVTSAIFVVMIYKITSINKSEKIFLSLLSVILLMSACQVESLLNPANLQWSLLVFTATLTAWFFYRAAVQKTALNIAGIVVGIVLTALTSASVFLILAPLLILVLGKKFVVRTALALLFLVLAALVISELFLTDYLPFIPVLLLGWLKFTVDFLFPPVERLHSIIATVFAGLLVFVALFKLARTTYETSEKALVFFALLLWFALFVIFGSGLLRSYIPTAFTFRFVNIGLLFAAVLFPILYLQTKRVVIPRYVTLSAALFYVGLIAYVNVTEASAFAFGRNHVKLTQVAHVLDINDSFVVSAMPGTMWEKIEFDTVQANKHKLQNAGTGIYGSDQFKRVGQSVDVLGNLQHTTCKTTVIKMRRLLPDQAAYRLLGVSKTDQDDVLSQAYFVDNKNIIRGFAISIEPNKNILKGLFEDKQWAGFVNFDSDPEQKSLMLYAYDDKQLCQGEKIDLPDYKDLRKKSENPE